MHWTNHLKIKYADIPLFSEVMAAGTAASLVPIRSITRRISPDSPQSLSKSSVKDHPRVSFADGQETIQFLPAEQEDAGQLCVKLTTQLKGIQLGKVEDQFGWCFKVDESDKAKVQIQANGA
jgi:branched-chain amino acid aminotransferase